MIARHQMPKIASHRFPRAESWNALFERFAEFEAMPCLMSRGPCLQRKAAPAVTAIVHKQFADVAPCLPERPCDLTQEHIDKMLRQTGRAARLETSKRSADALWKRLWRAIVLDCDDFRCYFCGRSGEEGIRLPNGQVLALRLQLDHVSSHGPMVGTTSFSRTFEQFADSATPHAAS